MANLVKVTCTACGVVYRLAAGVVRRAHTGLWCPVCLGEATAAEGGLTEAQRAEIRAAVNAILAEEVPALVRPRLDERRALKRRAEKTRAALKLVGGARG